MTAQAKIAAGHNQAGSLQTLYELSAAEFKHYKTGDPRTEWHDADASLMTASRQITDIGMPWCTWVISAMTPTGLTTLRTICPGKSADVTIQTYNKEENAYLVYNAIMLWPNENEKAWLPRGWSNTRVTFINLERYSGFSYGFSQTGFGVSA